MRPAHFMAISVLVAAGCRDATPLRTAGGPARLELTAAGTWNDWWTGAPVVAADPGEASGRWIVRPVDLATMPVYVRAGAIVPLDPVRQFASEQADEPTTLRVYPGADGRFVLFDDDGSGYGYDRGEADWILLTWNDAARTLTLEPAAFGRLAAPPVDCLLRVSLATGGASRDARYRGTRTILSW